MSSLSFSGTGLPGKLITHIGRGLPFLTGVHAARGDTPPRDPGMLSEEGRPAPSTT
jgi:hypothetical protein